MLNRRRFLQTSALVALSPLVPRFVANTALAAEAGKDKVLVVLEMGGGNDGLNTVIPHGDDLYHKARPTLRYRTEEVVKIDEHLGLNPGLRELEQLLGNKQLAIVQGVGYPNPNRSHFESMDIWQSADPRGKIANGWLGRSMGSVKVNEGEIPGMHLGADQLPLALQGSATGTPTLHPNKPYELILDGKTYNLQDLRNRGISKVEVVDGEPKEGEKPDPKQAQAEEKHRAARMQLIRDLAKLETGPKNDLLQFVQRSSLQTYTALDRLRKLMLEGPPGNVRFIRRGEGNGDLAAKLNLAARIIQAGFGTRIFYVAIDGFDTHSAQRDTHQQLLQQIGGGVSNFFNQLKQSGDADRVVLMTFSEFGRRVRENGSKGTDHGAGACLFVAGPKVNGGLVGKHPSLADLDAGDLQHHTDFRRVYATLLDGWLECDAQAVLGQKFEHLPLLKDR